MECYRCANIDPKKKKDGKVDGALYFCKKQKTFVNCSTNTCDKFVESDRKMYESDKFYEDGKKYYNDDKSPMFYVIILVIIVIFCLILGLIYGF